MSDLFLPEIADMRGKGVVERLPVDVEGMRRQMVTHAGLASALEILSANPAPSIGEQFWRAMDAMRGPAFSDAARAAANAAVPSLPGVDADSWVWRAASGEGTTDQSPALLALMRQEMSVFGSNAGAADLAWRKDAAAHPMDFFA